jgi:Carboxypeptidase regulatory-like domain/Major Facilitator Superfamily
MRTPLLPLRILADRNRGMAFSTVSLAALGLFGVFLFLTYQLQVVLGYSALKTGVALLPLVVMNVLAATQLAGRLLPRMAPRLLIVPGLLAAAGALGLLTQLTPDSPYAAVILPAELLLGLGIGSVFGPCVSVATAGIDPRDAGITSATVNTAQQVGASVGVALLNTIAASATTAYLASNRTGPRVELFATVHGYAVAATWAAGILLGTALLVALFINADPRQKAAAGAQPAPAEAAAAGSPPPAPAPPGHAGTVTGTVSEQSDCMRVDDALLVLTNIAGDVVGSCRSDGNGTYVFDGLPAGEYVLTASHGWYQPSAARVTVDGKQLTVVNLELAPSGRLLGVVRSVAGSPVAAAQVSLADRSGVTITMTTHPDGRYAFADLPAGEYVVMASAFGGRPVSTTVTVAGGDHRFDIPLGEGQRSGR